MCFGDCLLPHDQCLYVTGEKQVNTHMHTKTDSEKPACMCIDQYAIKYINSDREVEIVSETSNFYYIKMWLIV
jgi:hypothetical protein